MVSVIIPTYNRALLLSRAVQSVLDQTYQDFELIIIDDGSTDNTGEVINSFHNKKIKYIQHKKNEGAATARNRGIRASRGEYIAFLDSDDEWLQRKLEKQINVIKTISTKVGVVYTATWRIMNNKKYYIPAPTKIQKEGNLYDSILCGEYLVPTPAAMVRKECLEKVGMFDETLPALEEWDLWIKISRDYFFTFIDEPLVISHYTANSISTNRLIFCKGMKLIIKKHFREFRSNRKALISFCYRIGRLYIGAFLQKIGFIK